MSTNNNIILQSIIKDSQSQNQTQLYHTDKWCNLLKMKIAKMQKEERKESQQKKRYKTPFMQFTNISQSDKKKNLKIIKTIKENFLPFVEFPSKEVLLNNYRNVNDTFEDTSKNFTTRPLQMTQRNIWNYLCKSPLKRQFNNNYSLTNIKSVSKLKFQNLQFSLYRNNRLLLKDIEYNSKGVMTPRKLNDQDKYMNYIVRRVDNYRASNNDNNNNNNPNLFPIRKL